MIIHRVYVALTIFHFPPTINKLKVKRKHRLRSASLPAARKFLCFSAFHGASTIVSDTISPVVHVSAEYIVST